MLIPLCCLSTVFVTIACSFSLIQFHSSSFFTILLVLHVQHGLSSFSYVVIVERDYMFGLHRDYPFHRDFVGELVTSVGSLPFIPFFLPSLFFFFL